VHDYVIKPINLPLLLKKIQTALNNNSDKLELLRKQSCLTEIQQLAGIGTWKYISVSSQFRCSKEFYSIVDSNEILDDISFDTFLSFTHQDYRNKLKINIVDAIHNGTPSSLEHLMNSEDGAEYLILHRITVEKLNAEGNFTVSGVIMDITDRRNEQNLITQSRFYDIVTGLPNRDHFYNRMNSFINKNDNTLLGLLFISIDRFKNINETLGRHIGDKILSVLANQLTSYKNLIVFRYTGDIFAAVVKDMKSIIPATSIAEEIHKNLNEPIFIDDHKIYMSVSIGIAIHPLIPGNKYDLISCAESAMYQAKRLGCNRTKIFDKKSFKRNSKRLHLETELHKALDKDQFEIFYQPQIKVEDNSLIGMEALLRWNHPEHGIIKPDQFISIAEDTGLIIPLGEWVIETATIQCAKW